jgi:hypothetical protein
VSLREEIEADLAETLEDPEDFGLPVTLVDDLGDSQDYYGQILYDTLAENPETGAEIIIHKPVVTLRRSSLVRVPLPGENWVVKIPLTPSLTAPKVDFAIERPTEEGGAIGFIRLYLMRIEQS